MATRWVPVQAVLLLVLVIWTAYATDLFQARFTLSMIIVALGVVAVALTYAALRKGKEGLAFGMSGATIILMVASMFVGLFPNVMISTIDESFNLTVMNAASNPYTLKAMTIVAVCLLPFVLGYQIWSYYVFSKRVSTKDHLEY